MSSGAAAWAAAAVIATELEAVADADHRRACNLLRLAIENSKFPGTLQSSAQPPAVCVAERRLPIQVAVFKKKDQYVVGPRG
jgi:hypothetical protein